MSPVNMPALLARLLTCAALVVALGAAHKSDWYRAHDGASVASGPKLPIKSSFSGYIIAVG
jgi:hypothetical protein